MPSRRPRADFAADTRRRTQIKIVKKLGGVLTGVLLELQKLNRGGHEKIRPYRYFND